MDTHELGRIFTGVVGAVIGYDISAAPVGEAEAALQAGEKGAVPPGMTAGVQAYAGSLGYTVVDGDLLCGPRKSMGVTFTHDPASGESAVYAALFGAERVIEIRTAALTPASRFRVLCHETVHAMVSAGVVTLDPRISGSSTAEETLCDMAAATALGYLRVGSGLACVSRVAGHTAAVMPPFLGDTVRRAVLEHGFREPAVAAAAALVTAALVPVPA